MANSSPNRWDETVRSARDAALNLFRERATLVRTGPRRVVAPVFFNDLVIHHRTSFSRAAIAYDPERQQSLACANCRNELQILKEGTVWFHVGWNCCTDEIKVGSFDLDRPVHDKFIEEVAGANRSKAREPSRHLSDRQLLREYAARGLEQIGFRVGQIHHSGRIPRSRLLVFNGNHHSIVAVRSCLKRAVELKLDGNVIWRTIPNVDYVVVAAPAQDDPRCVEVSGFDPEKLLQVFNAVVSRSPRHKESSVSIALDPPCYRGAGSNVHLMAISEWSLTLPLLPNG